MKLTPYFSIKSILPVAILIMGMIACDMKPTPAPDDPATGGYLTTSDGSAAVPCECEDSWFPHTQTPPPAEGQGSPFDTTSTINCMFHQWSWQKFLWLTKPQSNGNPLFLNELIQVDASMAKVPQQSGATLALSSTGQAGGGGILKTNPNFGQGTSETVYYSIQMNDSMYNAAIAYADSLNAGTLPQHNTATFPINSLEVKAAWVNADAIPTSEIDNYFTTTAAIQQGQSYENQTMALIGIHVVGVVINHPEFIWASFEHKDMGPDYDWAAGNINSGNKLVYASGTNTGLGGITWTGTAPQTPDAAYSLFALGVPISPTTDTFMNTSQSEPENFNNVTNINSCVAGKLTDVFNNYFYKGSLWLNMDGLTPSEQADTINALGKKIANIDPGDLARGCVGLANLSMETFEQTKASAISSISTSTNKNCFSCHHPISFSYGSATSPLYLSHIFDGYLSVNNNGKTIKEMERLKLKQYLEDMK